ncbi:MAG TPA: hypothetical protein DCZ94_00180 [Lentisphaeria bacterium]|nr:MAG: hypothetical protein A2X48_15605 [Lentisphaerae bacterium GWF2_49_21]HBC85350.1 hypothetical protein [Lentisphaeria bacterium]
MELKREFSWSWSRYRCFESCKKAYHLRYTAAWQGWDRFSDENTRIVYALKNLRTFDTWTYQVFRDTVRRVFNESHVRNIDFNTVNLKRAAVRKLKDDWHSLAAFEWKTDPKKLNLSEIFYGKENLDGIFDHAVDKVFKDIASFSRNNVFEEIARLPYSNFMDLKNPVSFFLEDLKIWISPDFVFTDEKGLNLVNFFCGKDIGNDDWHSVTGLNVIYACRKFSVPEEKINARSVFTGEAYPDGLCAYSYRNTGELADIIRESALDMIEFENNSPQDLRPDSDSKCQNCEFRSFCLG